MNAAQLRERQSPLKAKYKDEPGAAAWVLHGEGVLAPENLSCRVDMGFGVAEAGLHPAAGGDGSWACSGDMLLQTLAACAGVTMTAVAAAMEIHIESGAVRAEGDLDFRGTLGVDKTAPVGFTHIRLFFDLETDASPDQLETLLKLTERYCVVLQTLHGGAAISSEINGG